MSVHGMRGPQHAPHHLARECDRDRAGILCNLSGQLASTWKQVVGRENFADQASLMGLLSVKDAAGGHPLHGGIDADHAGQKVAAAGLRYDTTSRKDKPHTCLFTREANIHRKSHGGTDSHRGAVDRGDHRFERLKNAQSVAPTGVSWGHAFRLTTSLAAIEGLGAAAEIGTGTKTSSSAGDDNGAYVIVGVRAIETGHEVQKHLVVISIESIRSVQSDGENTVLKFRQQSFKFHGRYLLRVDPGCKPVLAVFAWTKYDWGMDATTELPIPEVVGIDHIVLRTTRLPELLDFYENKLGLKLERHLKKFGLYQLRAGFALIDILDRSAADPAEESGDASRGDSQYDHFCLAITDLNADELIAWLEAEEIPHGKIERRYGATGEGTSVYAKDPDGRRVELKLVDED